VSQSGSPRVQSGWARF